MCVTFSLDGGSALSGGNDNDSQKRVYRGHAFKNLPTALPRHFKIKEHDIDIDRPRTLGLCTSLVATEVTLDCEGRPQQVGCGKLSLQLDRAVQALSGGGLEFKLAARFPLAQADAALERAIRGAGGAVVLEL